MLFHCATRCHRGAAARLFTNTLTPRPVDKSLLNGNTAAAFAPREINRSPMLDVVATGPCHRPVLIESSTDECLSAIIRYTCRDKWISLETNRRDERFRTTLNVSFGSAMEEWLFYYSFLLNTDVDAYMSPFFVDRWVSCRSNGRTLDKWTFFEIRSNVWRLIIYKSTSRIPINRFSLRHHSQVNEILYKICCKNKILHQMNSF